MLPSLVRMISPTKCMSTLGALGLLCVSLSSPVYGAERSLAEQLPPGTDDLPRDAAYRWGTLPNGLRYVVRNHAEPENKVSIRMLVYAGALEETEEQLGMAHFLEHLAFKGSDTFPDNSFVTVMQQSGVQHGSHSNAHTGFDETVYKLDLPADNPTLLATGMDWMSDVLGALHLKEEMVLPERGVILAEMRDRDNVGLRSAMKHFKARYGDMLLPVRWPIGTKEIIETTTSQGLRGYWEQWYRPDNAVVSIVGDLPLDDLEALVLEEFKDAAPPEGTLAVKPSLGSLAVNDKPEISIHREDGVTATTIRYYVVGAGPAPEFSEKSWRESSLASLAAQIINRRFATIAEDSSAPILSGSVGSWWWHDMRHGVVSTQVREDAVGAAVALMENEIRRFVQFGPTADEVDLAQQQILAGLRQAIARQANRNASQLATSAYQAIKNDQNLMSPEQTLAMWERLFQTVRGDDLGAILAPFFADQERHHSIEITTMLEVDPATVEAAFATAKQVEVTPPAAKERKVWPYIAAAEAKAPKDVSTTDLGEGNVLHSAHFANGVVLNSMTRSQKPKEVQLSLRLVHQPGSVNTALRSLASSSFIARGTGALTANEISRHLGTTSVRLAVNVSEDAIVFSGTALPEEIDQWLAYAAGLITDPGWRSERIEERRSSWLTSMKAQKNDLASRSREMFLEKVVGGDSHRVPATIADVEALTPDAVRAWLTPILQSSSIELAIVGDVSTEEMQSAVGRTLAQLDQRPAVESISDLNKFLLPSPAMPRGEFRVEDIQDTASRAMIRIAWPGHDMSDIQRVRRFGQLSRVLSVHLRQELRSAMGEAYSPGAGHTGSDVWKGHGYLQAVVSVAPDKVDIARDAILATAKALMENGVSDEVFKEVQTPALTNLPQWRANNAYWLNQVSGRAVSRPFRLDWSQSMMSDIASITGEELSSLAAQTFAQEPLIIIAVSP